MFRANAPQIYVDVNRKQCMAMGVPLGDLFNTLQVYLGSLYVNDFNLLRPHLAGDRAGRRPLPHAEGDGGPVEGPQQQGGMVPVGALATVKDVNGPLILTRYNTLPGGLHQRHAPARRQLPRRAST